MKNKYTKKYIAEAGYSGQGHSTGAESFLGGYFGFGGALQLATKNLDPSVAKIKKQEDEEQVYNVASQQKINRGYPSSQSTTGFAGGEPNSGIRSGGRTPDDIPNIGLTVDELEKLFIREPKDEYYGFADHVEEELQEQGAGAGAQGPGRAVASDANYRDLPGFPRHNTIEKRGDFIPKIEGDEDRDGETDVYLSDEEYVGDILQTNSLGIKPGKFKKMFGQENFSEAYDYSLKNLHNETKSYVSPGYGPEPDRSTERWKQGYREETPQGDDWLINHVDYSGGHPNKNPAKHSPGAQTYGQIGAPKNFVPDDWEQRHWKTKEEDLDGTDIQLENFIKNLVAEIFQKDF